MSILNETYIFYADVYLLQNWMIKATVLYLAFWVNKQHQSISYMKGMIKIALAAFLGTVVEILGLVLGNSYHLFLLIVYLLEIPMMVRLISGKKKTQIWKIILAGYFFLMLINSVLEALWNQFGKAGGYLFYLLFSCGGVVAGIRIWKNYTRIQKGIFAVQLWYKGKQVCTQALYDSGNRLMDLYTKQGVHIISKQLYERFEGFEAPVYIPYQSLGNEAGLLELYYIDELIIEGEKQEIRLPNCPVGVTKDNLFEGKSYEIILNEEVF